MKLTRRQSFASHNLYAKYAGEVTERTGMEPPKEKRKQGSPEKDTQNAIMDMLQLHPLVSWRVRLNSGGFTDGRGQFVRFGFVGCPDIWGQMKSGKLLCIEVKSPVGRVTEPQAAFLERVKGAGGHAGIARSVEDALAIVEGR